MALIKEHNKLHDQGKKSYRLGINEFADLVSSILVSEGKNQEDCLRSEVELLFEPDVSALLTDLLSNPWTSCDPACSPHLVKQIVRKCKIRFHSSFRRTQHVQHPLLLPYTSGFRVGGPFSDLIRHSWILTMMILVVSPHLPAPLCCKSTMRKESYQPVRGK